MYYSWLNLISLLLGLIAWFIPIMSLFKDKRKSGKNLSLMTLASMMAAVTTLWLQLLYDYYLL